MTLSANQASKVIVQEINLSQVITGASTSTVAQCIVSNQGSTVPMPFTVAQTYLNQYGNPNPQISFDQYCALDYFQQGSQLWGLRVGGDGATYAASILYTDAGNTYIIPVPGGVTDPTQPDWPAILQAIGAKATAEAIALIYPAKGPGSYGNSYATSIVSADLVTPANLTAVSASTGGIMPAATYGYQVSAIGSLGESVASSSVQVIIAASTVTNSITLSWSPVSSATGYNVYGTGPGGTKAGFIAQVGQQQGTTISFTDTGQITPDTTKAPITDPSKAASPALTFLLNVYDTSISSQYPREQFTCSLTNYTAPNGLQAEMELAVNPFSQYINVTSNVPALTGTLPPIGSVSLASMAGGDSGTAPTSEAIAGAWATFQNKQLYAVNILLNSGHADPGVQLAMDTLAQQRGDCIAFLDTPSTSQQAQQAINYRNLSLNLNSTYSAIFSPDVLENDTINGQQIYVPFSGQAAARAAYTDAVANPSFSIAGLNRGMLNVLGTRYTYDPGEMDMLFQAQVNYPQRFVQLGTALWEQQTLSAQMSALSWISVRRIVNVIKVSLYQFLLYSLQEPNDDFLGRQIVTSCSAYLTQIQSARGINSYSVVSDSSNNSAQDFNTGVRNVTVMLIPIIPVHIINLQVVISKQGVSFTEVLSSVNPG